MSSVMDEFYGALFKDWMEQGERSVLYRYFLKEKKNPNRIERMIRDFFNNAGYAYTPRRNRQHNKETREEDYTTAVLEEQLKKIEKRTRTKNNDHQKPAGMRQPKKDRMLTLLDAYCKSIGKTSLFDVDAESGLPEKKSVKKLFDFLCKNGKNGDLDEVRVPLIVDRVTGCSLELVGRSFYPHKDGAEPCAYLIYRYTNEDSKYNYGKYTMAKDTRKRPYRFSNYNDAMDQFELENKDVMEDLLEWNTGNKAILKLPKKLQKAFRHHFPNQRLNETSVLRKIEEREKKDAEGFIKDYTKREKKWTTQSGSARDRNQ